MNCGRVSNQLSAYLDRELAGIDMLQIRRHLDTCDRCRAEHDALSRMKRMLGQLQSVEPPPGLVSHTVRRFEASGSWGVHRAAGGADHREEASPSSASFGGVLFASLLPPRLVQVQEAVWQRLALVPWQPVTVGLTTAVLALALVFTNVVRHRQADATIASTPLRVRQGMDPLGADWPPGDFPLQPLPAERIFGSGPSLHWVNVSLEGDSSWPSR